MEINQKKIDISQEIVNRNDKEIISQNIENLPYLYPNGHRITLQFRWYKYSCDMGLKPNIGA